MVASVLSLALVGEEPIIDKKYPGDELSLFFFIAMIHNILMAHMTIHM